MATVTAGAKPKSKFYYGWWVAIGVTIVYCAYCSINWVNTICFPLLQKEFGWTATDLGLLMAISTWGSVLWSPIGGWICNRLGNRRTILIFFFLDAGVVLLYTTITALWQMVIYYSILAGFFNVTGSMVATMSLPRKWFIKHAGLATGLTGGVWGFISSVVFPGMSFLGAALGWRQAIFILVPIYAVIGIVTAVFLIHNSPEERGLHPDGVSDEDFKKLQAAMAAGNREETSMTLGQALRTPQLWMLGIAYGLTMDELGVIQGQSTVMATTYGVPIALAGIAMSALMIPAIISRTAIGPMGDRWGRRRMLIWSSAVAALVEVGGWLFVQDETTLLVFLVILGLTMMAGMTLVPPLCGDLFGRKNLAQIWGVCFAISSLVSGFVSLLTGYIRTVTGTYNLVFLVLAVNFVAQIILVVLFLRPTGVERQNLGKLAGK